MTEDFATIHRRDERELWRAELRCVEAILDARLTHLEGLTRMTEKEKELVRKLYDLQLQLFDIQGDEIAALEQANKSLKRSHEVIGEMLKVTGELVRPNS